ncbi:MAG: hypothetical protein CSA64_04170 [Arachnia propionica]|nr:MAG: hypothetical protein CSA64_04170 [Arachnia propionica]
MRVLVAADRVATLSAVAATETIAAAFAARGAQVAAAPLASDAESLSRLVPADQLLRPETYAEALALLADSLRPGCVIDLTVASSAEPDFAALQSCQRVGAVAGVTVITAGATDQPLTGLNGLVAQTGRDRSTDLAEIVSLDAAMAAWASGLGVTATAPGSGAAGGVGAVALAAGARVMTPWGFAAEQLHVAATAAKADVIVTACEQLDADDLGGPAVASIVEIAREVTRPIVVIAGNSFVPARQLRVLDIEAAYPLVSGPAGQSTTPEQLRQVAERVARTWSW